MSAIVAFAGRARRLTADEWRLLAVGLIAAVITEAALRLWSMARILRAIERWPVESPSAMSAARVRRMARLAAWPYQVLPLRGTCLRVSLVRLVVLRRRRVPATLCLGVRRIGASLEAHAWVECVECGGPLGDEPDLQAYQRLEPLPIARLSSTARSAI